MEAARLPGRQSREPLALARRLLIVLLLALAVVAWVVTDDRMRGMDAGPATDLGSLGFYVTVWVVMMAAMMFPSIVPMVLTYARVQAGRRERGRDVPAAGTTAFVAGYLVAWTAYGLVAYALIKGVRAVDIEVLAWDRAGRWLAGGVIVAAAIYQLTPAKNACLTRCRNPFAFLTGSWRDGLGGALRMGAEHGAWCVGCCWALMAALLVLGVMSVGWMAFIAALIAIEKLLPWKALANRGIAVLLLCLGLAVALVPDDTPGLVVPGSPEARDAMMRMEGPGSGSGSGMPGMDKKQGMERKSSDPGMPGDR
jgi:predicted metal-binding membrane protein